MEDCILLGLAGGRCLPPATGVLQIDFSLKPGRSAQGLLPAWFAASSSSPPATAELRAPRGCDWASLVPELRELPSSSLGRSRPDDVPLFPVLVGLCGLSFVTGSSRPFVLSSKPTSAVCISMKTVNP